MVLPSHSLAFFVNYLTRLPCICQLFVPRFTRQFSAPSPFLSPFLIYFFNKLFFFLQVTWWGCYFLVFVFVFFPSFFLFMLRQFYIEFLYSPSPMPHPPNIVFPIPYSQVHTHLIYYCIICWALELFIDLFINILPNSTAFSVCHV